MVTSKVVAIVSLSFYYTVKTAQRRDWWMLVAFSSWVVDHVTQLDVNAMAQAQFKKIITTHPFLPEVLIILVFAAVLGANVHDIVHPVNLFNTNNSTNRNSLFDGATWKDKQHIYVSLQRVCHIGGNIIKQLFSLFSYQSKNHAVIGLRSLWHRSNWLLKPCRLKDTSIIPWGDVQFEQWRPVEGQQKCQQLVFYSRINQ